MTSAFPFRYGEIVNINLVRDKKTGKSKGFCFICYEDQRSTILAVDNFNGIKVSLSLGEEGCPSVLVGYWSVINSCSGGGVSGLWRNCRSGV